jgi:hypothetical protein
MFRSQRAGRSISMLLAVALLGLGAVWGGVAVASTIGGGGGGVRQRVGRGQDRGGGVAREPCGSSPFVLC